MSRLKNYHLACVLPRSRIGMNAKHARRRVPSKTLSVLRSSRWKFTLCPPMTTQMILSRTVLSLKTPMTTSQRELRIRPITIEILRYRTMFQKDCFVFLYLTYTKHFLIFEKICTWGFGVLGFWGFGLEVFKIYGSIYIFIF